MVIVHEPAAWRPLSPLSSCACTGDSTRTSCRSAVSPSRSVPWSTAAIVMIENVHKHIEKEALTDEKSLAHHGRRSEPR